MLRSLRAAPNPHQGESRMSTIAPAPAAVSKPQTQPLLVRRAAVLGAGTMGSRIAAHLANAGIPVLLLDLPAREPGGKPLPAGLEALAKSKPAAYYEASPPRSSRPAPLTTTSPNCPMRLGRRGGRRKSRHQDGAAGACHAASRAPSAAHHQHLRPAHCADRRRPRRCGAQAIFRHALLQSAALHAAA